MIKILILDDDAEKIHKIIKEIVAIKGIAGNDISSVSDVIQAKRALKDSDYDLLLLDIQIPNRFGEEPLRDGGVRLLKELVETNRYRRPTYIVGVTAFEDVYRDFSNEFSDRLWAVVNCGDDSVNWLSQIINKVKYILDLKNGLRVPVRTEYDFDLAIVTAKDEFEFDSVVKLIPNLSPYDVFNDASRYYIGSIGTTKVVASAAIEMGMTPSSVLSTKMIVNFCPKFLAMVGVAGGVQTKVNIGDIIVADPSWDYGLGKIEEVDGKTIFKPDPKQLRINTDLKAKIQELQRDKKLLRTVRDEWPGEKPANEIEIHMGPVGTGASVLADQTVQKTVLEHNRSTIGFDMETYGVLFAAENAFKPRPTAFSMKSVCDFGNHCKDDKYQPYAAYVSARVMKEFVAKYLCATPPSSGSPLFLPAFERNRA